jgi:hypothetical protein
VPQRVENDVRQSFQAHSSEDSVADSIFSCQLKALGKTTRQIPRRDK